MYGREWQTRLAERVRVDPRTVRRWKAGDREIPGWLMVVVEMLERHEDER
jgi:hypothetical protein